MKLRATLTTWVCKYLWDPNGETMHVAAYGRFVNKGMKAWSQACPTSLQQQWRSWQTLVSKGEHKSTRAPLCYRFSVNFSSQQRQNPDLTANVNSHKPEGKDRIMVHFYSLYIAHVLAQNTHSSWRSRHCQYAVAESNKVFRSMDTLYDIPGSNYSLSVDQWAGTRLTMSRFVSWRSV